VDGPSIRLAETIAMRWGNFSSGVKEIARRDGYSEVVAFACDLQANTWDTKTFQVKHWRDTKKGGYAVHDERDIYEVIANSGARRKRACILALIPKDVIEAALRQCDVTLRSKIEIDAAYVAKIVETFDRWGVTQEMIEKRLQRKLDALTPALALQLRKIANSLKDGMSAPGDWFDVGAQSSGKGPEKSQSETERMAAELAAKAGTKPDAPKGVPPDDKPPEPETPKTPPKAAEQVVRETIAAAGSQDALQAILADIVKLPPTPIRAEIMQEWNAKVMALQQPPAPSEPAKPAQAAAPSTKGRKEVGTQKECDKIVKRMEAAKTRDALDEIADYSNLYVWSPLQDNTLKMKYVACAEALNAQ